MRAFRVVRDWWFSPRSPAPLGLFRIACGTLVLVYTGLLWPVRSLWFSDGGVVAVTQADNYNAGDGYVPRLDLLHDVSGDRVLTLFFVLLFVAAFALMIGLWTRPAAFIVWISILSLHNRDGIIVEYADYLLLAMAAYLLISPAGAACSVDRLIRLWRGRGDEKEPSLTSPWVQRLMQINVAMVYAFASIGQLHGPDWRAGLAVYYPLHSADYARFPWFWIDGNHLWLVHAVTWGVIAVEMAMWTLIWIPRLRPAVLVVGALFQWVVAYSLNLSFFSWMMLACLLLFTTSEDIETIRGALSRHLRGLRLRLVYDGECGFCRSVLLVLRYFDVLRLITALDYHRPEELAHASGVRFEDADSSAIAVDVKNRQFRGFFAFRQAARRIPLLWPCLPVLYMPGIPAFGQRIYQWTAANRSRLPVAPRCRSRRANEKATQPA